jgi:hypothetical protein
MHLNGLVPRGLHRIFSSQNITRSRPFRRSSKVIRMCRVHAHGVTLTPVFCRSPRPPKLPMHHRAGLCHHHAPPRTKKLQKELDEFSPGGRPHGGLCSTLSLPVACELRKVKVSTRFTGAQTGLITSLRWSLQREPSFVYGVCTLTWHAPGPKLSV